MGREMRKYLSVLEGRLFRVERSQLRLGRSVVLLERIQTRLQVLVGFCEQQNLRVQSVVVSLILNRSSRKHLRRFLLHRQCVNHFHVVIHGNLMLQRV